MSSAFEVPRETNHSWQCPLWEFGGWNLPVLFCWDPVNIVIVVTGCSVGGPA